MPYRTEEVAVRHLHMKSKGIKKTTVPNLYRVNYPEHGQVGFLVKLNRKRKRIYRVFNFSQYTSQAECRKHAETYAREVNEKYPALTRRELAELLRPGSTRGMVGVRKISKEVKGRPYAFWEASWSPRPNEAKKKLFSVDKYGEKEAKRLAMEARREGLQSMAE
jgi:hypothetical protein